MRISRVRLELTKARVDAAMRINGMAIAWLHAEVNEGLSVSNLHG
jgi:hypothetical protein